MDTSLGNDGGCTGFQWLERWVTGIDACCGAHDLGGSDGQLLDCLMSAVPTWAWPLVGFGVAGMILLRPLYNLGQRKGWWD